jgi:hypothetical protein
MKRSILSTAMGTIFGSIIEEGIEELFPGVGELGNTGELFGAIVGLLSSQFTKDEIKQASETFIKYAYKSVNSKSLDESITDDEINLFSKRFKELPSKTKKEIINNYKNLAPYEFSLIIEFLNNMETR